MTDYPSKFKYNIKTLLKDKADDFFSACEKEPVSSLRVNTLKTDGIGQFFPDVDFSPVKWCGDAYYYPSSFKAGKTALHVAGAFSLVPQLLAAAAPVMGLACGKRGFPRLPVHPGQHEHFAGGSILGNGGNKTSGLGKIRSKV